jgi:hypothetical protein
MELCVPRIHTPRPRQIPPAAASGASKRLLGGASPGGALAQPGGQWCVGPAWRPVVRWPSLAASGALAPTGQTLPVTALVAVRGRRAIRDRGRAGRQSALGPASPLQRPQWSPAVRAACPEDRRAGWPTRRSRQRRPMSRRPRASAAGNGWQPQAQPLPASGQRAERRSAAAATLSTEASARFPRRSAWDRDSRRRPLPREGRAIAIPPRHAHDGAPRVMLPGFT